MDPSFFSDMFYRFKLRATGTDRCVVLGDVFLFRYSPNYVADLSYNAVNDLISLGFFFPCAAPFLSLTIITA